ncbi:MAG: calcineurin-like phosphoesterase family protein [Bacteroidales bacterium]|nr:calcineurin-like phosphoesterase family protein [Bacteroidales bacterium]
MKIKFRHLLLLVVLTAACNREEYTPAGGDEVTIYATASLQERTAAKMIYEDHCDEGKGILSGWKTGDTFLALEVNGSTVTPVTFTATAPADVKTTFVSSGAVSADENTVWVAVLGKRAAFDGSSITCSYSGQDGTLKNLENYDYVTASSKGGNPDFNYGGGRHLSHIEKIKLPEGVCSLEFNTCERKDEYRINSDASVDAATADYHAQAVRTLTTGGGSKSGQTLYLAVPAIDYSEAGLIVTFFNSDRTRSTGRVLSRDLSAEGGRMGSADFSGMEMIDRPAAGEAVDFVSESFIALKHYENTSYSGINDEYEFHSCPKWAPYNLGAKAAPASAEEFYGEYFAWGETSLKESFSWNSYKHASDHSGIGYRKNYVGKSDIPLEFGTICGTKYDAARVQWGTDWRLPSLEEMLSLLGNNEILNLTSGGKEEQTSSGFYTRDLSTFNGTDVKGRSFTKNGRTIFLPYSGRFGYAEGGETSAAGQVGKIGYYYCGTHNNISGSKEAYRLLVRPNQVEPYSQEAGYGFSVRPVLAAGSTAEDPEPVKVSGRVSDKSTGRGIAGVLVSDGYTVCKTNTDGSYTLQADPRARTINFTIPAAYEFPLDGEGKPAFYKKVALRPGTEASASIELTPRAKVDERFTIIALADVHVQTNENLARFKNDCVPDIRNTISELAASGEAGTIIGIGLGDQLWDNHASDLTTAVKKVYTGFSVNGAAMPFFYCIGNHDHSSGVGKTDIEATNHFVDNFSPTDYSFDIGNAHVIVVDDIDYTGSDEASGAFSKIKYKERISGEKLHWIRQDIANVEDKENKAVIFCTHSPVYNALGNSEELKRELRVFAQAHILSGHIHNMSNHFMNGYQGRDGSTIIEHNIQSLCGMWWLADLSPNGTPAGYGVFTFKGKGLYSEYNKITKESKDFQMRVYNGNDVYNGRTPGAGASQKHNEDFKWDSSYRGKFLVRVWNGDGIMTSDNEMTWKLSFVKDGKSTPMTYLKDNIVDKCSASYIVNILGSPNGTGGSATSTAWWAIDAPGGDPAKESGWKIVAEHHLPSGWKQTYETSVLNNNYYGYPCGSKYPTTY